MRDSLPRVLLTSTSNSFEAYVIHARLQTEGVDAELRGAVGGGPYPFTIGAMGEVQIYVPPAQLDDARLVMLATEIDAAVDEDPSPARTTRIDVLTVTVVLAVVVIVTVARIALAS